MGNVVPMDSKLLSNYWYMSWPNTLGEFILFADDTKIFIVDENDKTAYKKANNLLTGVNKHMTSNYLHINVGKSGYMHLKPMLDRVEQTCAQIRCFSQI